MNLLDLSEWVVSSATKEYYKFLKYSNMERPTDIKIIISCMDDKEYNIVFYDEYKILSTLVSQSFETSQEAMNFADNILERSQKLQAFF